MKVTIYSHNFCVSGYNRYGYQFLKQFGISNFGEVDYRAIRSNKWGVKMGRAPLPTIKRTYAASLNNGREFRFHINCLDMFKEAVSRDSTLRDTIEYEHVELYKPTSVEINVLPKYSPREEQVPLVDYLKSPGTSKVLTLRTGGGKMQDVNEPVLTVDGWKPIGNVKLGEYIYTPKGKKVQVNGIYHHLNKALFDVCLADGRSTLAGGEHLWKVKNKETNQVYVMDTEGIAARLEMGIPLSLPNIDMFPGFHTAETADYYYDPFMYGVLHTAGSSFMGQYGLWLESPELISRMEAFAKQYHLQFEVLTSNRTTRYIYREYTESAHYCTRASRHYSLFLRKNGLIRTSKHLRKLNETYLNGPVEVREQLLDGMLTVLGNRSKNRRALNQVIVTGEHLRDDLVYLLRSLGRSASYEVFNNKRTDGILSYRVSYSTLQARWIDIAEVRPNKIANAVCIQIDDEEHLYVTRDFIVTHNTYCALQAASDYNERIIISIEKRFFNLWNEALEKNDDPEKDKQILDLLGDNILYVSGSKELNALMELALEDKLRDIKVIIIASRTLGIYFETYERFAEDALLYYPVLPIHLYELLGAGTRIKDELHLSLHANFTEELYLHAPRSYSLSATLEDGSFKDQILAVMFPMDMRAPASKLVKYIAVTGLMYKLREPDDAVFTIRGSTDYNHNAYEQWILKDPKRKSNYLSIVNNWLAHRYLKIRIPGQRAAIFATSVEMATEMQASLKRCYPDLTIARYAASAGDVYNEAREADVLVTTVQSFGTGFDLDGLICSLMTTSINSHNTNVQVLGRLRELRKWPDLTPVFDYLVCEDIPKQIAYHEEKIRQFTHRVKSHLVSYINTKV